MSFVGYELALKALKVELKKKENRYNKAKELSALAGSAPFDLINLFEEAKTVSNSNMTESEKVILYSDMRKKQTRLHNIILRDPIKLYDAEIMAENEFNSLMYVVAQFERMFCQEIASGAE